MTQAMKHPPSDLTKGERLARALDQVMSGNRPFNMQLAAQIKHELRRMDAMIGKEATK
jgi:hypothetical protein